jgi:regulator of protease activity HflC (stomatin/prohibitin superfamily)
MNKSSKRAEHVAITGLVISLIFCVAAWIVGSWSGAFAVRALSAQIFGGVLIWFVLTVLFHQRSLAEREKLDMSHLANAEQAGTIFQAGVESEQLIAIAQRRLIVLEKWFIPIFAVLIAIYNIVIGFVLLGRISDPLGKTVIDPMLAAIFMVIIAFVGFLISRYATGMSVEQNWKPLRAGGSSMLATSILAFALTIGMSFAHFKMTTLLVILDWVVPVLVVILGFEIALNAVLDIYRPRISGQYRRDAFDSRLLGFINEPGGILHTVASAIDYQFGFKVSQTWFYKLLEKAILPLLLFLVFTLYILSCIVIVPPGHQALIEHYGSFDKIVGPGITLKLPSPFDMAYMHPTSRIQQIDIGYVVGKEEISKPILWGEKHYQEEYDLLVATSLESQPDKQEGEGAVPVSIVRAAVPVQFKIKNLKDYVYNQSDAKKMLEAISYREVVRFAASARIETDNEGQDDSDERMSILGAGRQAAADYLKDKIQNEADRAGLGIEIVFLGLQGVHPPPDVAADYQAVVAAIQKKQASILMAQAESNATLTLLTGSVAKSQEIYDLGHRYLKAAQEGDEELVEKLTEQIGDFLANAEGDVFKILRQAQSYAFAKEVNAEAAGKRFKDQIKAYKASPDIYRQIYLLSMLEEVLKDIRKYVVVAGDEETQIIIIDLKDDVTPSIYDLNIDEITGKK